jgi:hypothetical protein
MWWRGQNLEKPVLDSAGKPWNFRVWYDFIDGMQMQRIFFWDENKQETGIVEFQRDQALDHKKIKQRILKIVHDPEYRKKYLCKLKFPVERFYGEYKGQTQQL